MKIKQKEGFTLIELLVTIVIIGILAGISFSTYQNYINKAEIAKDLANLSQKITKLKLKRMEYEAGVISSEEVLVADLSAVAEAIYIARKKQKKNLVDITCVNCSDCICRGESFNQSPLSPKAQNCLNSWNQILTTIKDGSEIDLSFIESDPWGSPYLVDENEGERANDYCRKDTLFSAGPDKIHQAVNEESTEDGYSIRLDYFQPEKCQ